MMVNIQEFDFIKMKLEELDPTAPPQCKVQLPILSGSKMLPYPICYLILPVSKLPYNKQIHLLYAAASFSVS